MKTNIKTKPYTPVRYTDLEYRLFNLISSKNLLIQMPVGKEIVSVRFGFDKTDLPLQFNDIDYKAHLAFEVSDELWQISFQKTRFLYELFEMVDDSGYFARSQVESLPEDILWAMLEAFLEESLGRIEAVLGVPVKITAPVNPSEVACFNMRFEMAFRDDQDAEKSLTGFLMTPLTESCVARVEELFSTFPTRLLKSDFLAKLKKTVFIEAGRLKLKARELSNMEVGDVLIPDIWYPKENKVALRVSTDLFFCGYDEQAMAMTVAVKSSVMDESIDNITINSQIDKLGRDDMTQENKESENKESENEALENEALENKIVENKDNNGLKNAENLDLELVFEVGKTTMTVEEIKCLAKGQVIQLPHKLDAGLSVNIKVDEQLVAKGKIVGVGDDFGVQIIKTADK